MTKMNQRQAWLRLEILYSDKEILPISGLCHEIGRLKTIGLIDTGTFIEMHKCLHEYEDIVNPAGAYFWPLNKEGAEMRAVWCINFAETC